MENKLIHIDFHGVNFTWINNKTGHEAIYERIDKAFCNYQWKDIFPEAITWNLPILLYDHNPIILQLTQPSVKRKRPYKLENWCLDFDDIILILANSWNEVSKGSHQFDLQRKMYQCIIQAKIWCINYKKENKINWQDIYSIQS